ncbi:GSCOCG00011955001-RA-CDS [Cotesia congregata]|uniref:Similar to LRP1: Prolow-density lipoprotein receptor-related protein 1 (Homo sapiens) n=1 Tax=Cotesia congregata TaxID=51543 RepID=A0A8J2MN29_COTCN|nr:GSCOCG00011955001-RA-CDS [Cotesia congregata]CAG5084752.1 Similar to LRP1: Prolow-density lipoprotein receptor-related protein 1 (Homo sapiens) [Cotesia congregata]
MSNFIILLFTLGLIGNLSKATSINGTFATIPIDQRAAIEIQPQFEIKMGQKYIFKKNNDSLNLTCTIIQNDGNKNHTLFDYIVDWKTPFYDNYIPKPERGQKRNVAWLWFENLSEDHDGNYTCNAVTFKSVIQSHLSVNIRLSVKKKPIKWYCGPKWFRCRSNNCIMERYLCDGKADCEEGEDESEAAGCGSDPCHGKVMCDNRCVPREWCCNHRNCSKNSAPHVWPTETRQISYIQTAFYVVMGCAMAFIFIVTILAIAICRVQFKRAISTTCNQRSRNSYCQTNRASSIHVPNHHDDLDRPLNRPLDDLQREASTMYNVTGKLQFTDCLSKPPSYSEIMALQSEEGPPPVYVSCDELNEYCALRMYNVQNSYQPDNLLPIISNLSSSRCDDFTSTPNSILSIQRPTSMNIPVSSSSTNGQNNDLGDDITTIIQDPMSQCTETDAFLSENSRTNNHKNSIRSVLNKKKKISNGWFGQNFNNVVTSKLWVNNQTDQNTPSSPLERKSYSLGDLKSERSFLITDQPQFVSDCLVRPMLKSNISSSFSTNSNNQVAGPSSSGVENDKNLH